MLLSYISVREGFTYQVVGSGRNRSVEITYNSQIHTHRHATVGNHLVISSRWLRETLGFSYERSTHLPGDIFSSTSTAALAWGLTYYAHSNLIGNPREFSSNILLATCGGFYFDEPLIGGRDWVGLREIRSDQTRAAFIHSHPRLPARFGYRYWAFSPGDRQNVGTLGVRSYLVAPPYRGARSISIRYSDPRVNRRGVVTGSTTPRTAFRNLRFTW